MYEASAERSMFVKDVHPVEGGAEPIAKVVPPRVDIDGFNLAMEEGTGVATYARSLKQSIQAIGGRVGVLYGRRLQNHEPVLREMDFFDTPRRRWSRIRSIALASQSLWSVRATEVELTGNVIFDDLKERFPEADVFWNVDNLFSAAATFFNVFGRSLVVRVPRPPAIMHWTYPLPIRVAGAKNIYTLHDMVPMRLPHTTLDDKRRYLKMVRHIARTADHIVTVSESSKADITGMLGLRDDQVTNTYQCFEPDSVNEGLEANDSSIHSFLGLEAGKYFLFFGAIEPKKNVNRLLEAYLSVGSETPLVIVGKNAWMHERELRLLKLAEFNRRAGVQAGWNATEAGEVSRVLRIEHLPRKTLNGLIRNCRAVIFPSLYEGFGLPVVEAMSQGAPVITSNTSSLPEIAGNAALLVDPYSVSEIAEAIRKMDRDPLLRQELAARGRKRAAAMFSPEIYSERLRKVYAGVERERDW